jgi:hypothetical protein
MLLLLKRDNITRFSTLVFSLNSTLGSTDSWANAGLNVDSNFLLDNVKLKILFYCHEAGKIIYSKADFWID